MTKQDLSFIKQQANHWLVKLETGTMEPDDEDRFIEWLEKDTRHGEAFYEAEKTWTMIHEVPKSSFGYHEQKLESPISPKKTWWTLGSLAATFILVISGLVFSRDIYFSITSDHYTSTGVIDEIKLEDGSTLTLNTDSAVTIQFTSDKRMIRLLEGELYVSVAPDRIRPFQVEAGNMKVTALGTAFTVNIEEARKPFVVVTEHKVKVESSTSPDINMTIEEGQKARLLEERNRLTVKDEVNTFSETAWTQGRYVFVNETIEKVVQELNRYYDGKIIIRGSSLRKRKVTGVLDLDKPFESLESLSEAISMKVKRVTPFLIVIE